MGFPGDSDSKESACNAGDLGVTPGLGRSPWKRAWQPTPVFLPGESPWTKEPGYSLCSHKEWDTSERLSTAQVGCNGLDPQKEQKAIQSWSLLDLEFSIQQQWWSCQKAERAQGPVSRDTTLTVKEGTTSCSQTTCWYCPLLWEPSPLKPFRKDTGKLASLA